MVLNHQQHQHGITEPHTQEKAKILHSEVVQFVFGMGDSEEGLFYTLTTPKKMDTVTLLDRALLKHGTRYDLPHFFPGSNFPLGDVFDSSCSS